MIARFRSLPVLLLLSQPALAQGAAEMNRRIALNRDVKEIALSPDGRTIASVITDTTAAGGKPHLWLLSKDDAPKQLTNDGEDASLAWARDGKTILYIEKRAGAADLKRIVPDSGRIETLALARQSGGWGVAPTGRPLLVKGFAEGPSGTLALWASEPSDSSEKSARKEDQHVFGQSDPVRLYLLDGRAPPREIALPDDVRTVSWSGDGGTLLVVTTSPNEDLGAPNRVWRIEPDKAPAEIRGMAEDVQSIAWLPDGRIAYVARCSRDAPIVCRDLYVQALDGSVPRNLTDTIDGSLINGLDGAAKVGPIVTRDGDIVVTIARRFDQKLARIRPGDGHVDWVASFPAVVKAVATNADRSGFAMLAAERGATASVDLADSQLRGYAPVLTPDVQARDWAPLRARRLIWTSDGQTIDGLLYLPAGASAARLVPLVVNVHGGPAGRFEDSDYPLVRLLLASGWAVLQANPRGSFGYGIPFLAAVRNDLGGADYRDIMRGIDAAIAHAPIDRAKLALIGYSYGATMTTFALGRTDRFKAMVAVAPVTDQISEYGTEGSSWYDRWYFGQPWRRLEDAWRQSPLAGVASARRPLLLLHGEADPVNPTGQSFELYRALRQEKAPVELILFPRETHHEIGQNFYGFASVEPSHGIALRQRILDFLSDAFAGKPRAGLGSPDQP